MDKWHYRYREKKLYWVNCPLRTFHGLYICFAFKLSVEHFNATLLVANLEDRDLFKMIIHRVYILLMAKIFLSLPSIFHLFPSAKKKRLSEFHPDHPGRGWEACGGGLPAVVGSGGLCICHLCDHPVGTVGAFLHPQDTS